MVTSTDIDIVASSEGGFMTPLICASKFDAHEACRLLIKRGAEVLSRHCIGQSPLHYAARKGNLRVIEVSFYGITENNLIQAFRLYSRPQLLHQMSNVRNYRIQPTRRRLMKPPTICCSKNGSDSIVFQWVYFYLHFMRKKKTQRPIKRG